jgi:hypothetical protein
VLPQCLAISGKCWEQRRNVYCDISRKYWENTGKTVANMFVYPYGNITVLSSCLFSLK